MHMNPIPSTTRLSTGNFDSVSLGLRLMLKRGG